MPELSQIGVVALPYRCHKCHARLDDRYEACPYCGGRQTAGQPPEAKARRDGVEIHASTDADEADADIPRVATGWRSLDEVFGRNPGDGAAGIARGGVSLIWGEAGVGKTTLIMQLCASATGFGRTLFASSEQSATMLKAAVAKAGAQRAGFELAATTDLDELCDAITRRDYDFVIVDSISRLVDAECDSEPGSIRQIRRCAAALVDLAHAEETTLLITSHVRGDGRQAGGTFVVHGVDTTLVYEGDLKKKGTPRFVRVEKNRFGESGVRARFAMGPRGLAEQDDEPEKPARSRGGRKR